MILNKAKVFSNRNNNTQNNNRDNSRAQTKLIPERLGLMPYIFNLFYQEYHNIGFEEGKIEELKEILLQLK